MMKSIKNKKGHYVVEASIILPIMLIGILTITGLCKIFAIYENVMFAAADESRAAMINSYHTGSDLLLTSRTEKRINDENNNVKNVDVYNFKTGYKDGEMNNLISFNLKFKINVTAPLPLINKTEKEGYTVCRKFVGNKDEKTNFTFDRMEQNEEGNIVYIFPNDGKRYHKKECSYVKPKATEVILTESIKKKYEPCRICKTDTVSVGSKVYLFLDYGDSYHMKNCNTVEKDTVGMERDIAIKKGYSKCSKCGG